jgi:hypothetical protein
VIKLGPFGIDGRPSLFDVKGFGWRHLFWRLWWFSPRAESTMLEAYARLLGVDRLPGESNEALRTRMVRELARPHR